MLLLLRLFLAFLLVVAAFSASEGAGVKVFSDIRDELEASVAELLSVVSRLEALQQLMERSAKANRDYDEQKNIFLSSMLASTTIVAVCQYEADQLTLFLDLRDKNRRKYHDLRIESLETSIRQIRHMDRQIRINYTIFPADFFEQSIVQREQKALAAALAALQKSADLLRSIKG